jgi:hypothetical protein
MVAILAEARTATLEEVQDWVVGPWIGREIFVYYRPVTSLVMFAEFRLFGEHSAPWQALSLALHLGSTALLALFIRRLFRSCTAGIVGALLWGFRDKMALAIEWTPAQTDLLAGFFALLCLLTLKLYLEERRWFWLLLAAPSGLLAMGSKEVALILPLLVTALALHAGTLPRKKLAALLGTTWLLTLAFLLWRSHALRGMGFMPGQGTHPSGKFGKGRSSVGRITPGGLAQKLLAFLLPLPLGPNAPFPALATLGTGATAALTHRLSQTRSPRTVLAAAGIGLLLVTLLMSDPQDGWMLSSLFDSFLSGLIHWLMPDTYFGLLFGLAMLALLVFALKRRPRDGALLLAWGVSVWLPLYHVVFNSAGNVTYLPDTYWALVWGWIAAALTAPTAADLPPP